MKPILFSLSFILLFALGLFILKPISIGEPEEWLSVTGKVSEIREGGVKDIVFQLEGEERSFYINRGFEKGFELQALQTDLVGEEITLLYPDYFAILNPDGSSRHVTELRVGNEVLYTEAR